MIKQLLKHIFLQLFFALGVIGALKAQNMSGLWYGKSPLTKTAGYHLSSTEPSGEILSIKLIENDKISGYCYSYYWFRGDFYYYITSVEGSVNPLKKEWQFKEIELLDNHLFFAHYYCAKSYSIIANTQVNKESLIGTWTAGSLRDCGIGTSKFSRKKPGLPQSSKIYLFEDFLKNLIDKDSIKENIAKKADSIKIIPVDNRYDDLSKRTNTLVKAIFIKSPEIKIELLDNGAVDNDTITVYFNKTLLLRQARISKQPIIIQLKALPNQENELIMYADNLGDIPPNTAEMRVYADGKRHNILISSDEKKNGTIRFLFIERK